MSSAKTLLSAAAAAAAFFLSNAHGFVIQLRSEEEFADAVESYPSLAVHFHDPASEASRQFAAQFRTAGREMLQQQQQASFGVQFASVDRTAEDFQNVVAALGSSRAGSGSTAAGGGGGGGGGNGADVQVYVDAQPVDPRLLQPVMKATNAAELVLGVRTAAGKAMSRNKAKNSNSNSAPAGTANGGGGGEQPKPKPKPKPTKAQQKDKKTEKKTKAPKAKDKAKGKPQKQKQPPQQHAQKQKQMHNDEDLLVEPATSKVQILTEGNFDAAIAGNSVTLVKFYAPWCGHCKRMAPRFTAASEALAADGIALAKIDQTVHRSIGQRYQVSSFPTLLIFEGERFVKKYDGGRTTDEITAYMRAYKHGATTKKWDPHATEGDPNDPCLQEAHAISNYGKCCGQGNFEKPGHLAVCNAVRDEVKKARRAAQEL